MTGDLSHASGGQDESWKVALAVSKKIGYVPIAFSQAIRLLITDHLKNKGQISAATKYQVSRVFKGASFKSTIYFASRELREDHFANVTACSVGDLVALYTPLDLAAFITCFFLNRRLKKAGGDVWPLVSPQFSREASIGALVGVAIPTIGYAPGLLLSALRNVSHALMSVDNPKSYEEFRKNLIASKKMIDEDLERKLWKTTSSQVSSMILTALGFKSEVSEIIGSVVNTTQRAAEIKNPQVQSFRLAHLWNEAFVLKREQPLEKLNSTFFPLEKDRVKASPHIEAALNGRISWLDRGKDDLNPQLAPHLFAKKKEDPNLEIPDELKDVFNIEELSSMEEEDFDRLIDQIEAEQKASSKRDDVISKKDLEELEKQCE